MESKILRNYFFYLTCSIVILAGLKAASEIVVLLFLSIFIASIFSSILVFFQKKRIPKLISYFLVLLIFIGFNFLLIYIINISLKDFSENITLYEEKLKTLILSSISFAESYGYSIDKNMIFDNFKISPLFSFTTNILGSIGSFLSKFLLIVIGIAFILAESKSFEDKIKLIFNYDDSKLHHFKIFTQNIQKYFLVKTFTSFLTGFIITVMLLLTGVDYPILWGVLAMLFNFIPVVGSIIAAIPAVLISLLGVDINTTIFLIVLYVIINISISNIIEPKLMGKELGLSPMVIFFSLILWGWVLGIVGMFLAVPITMTLKIAFNSNTQTKWLALLMSDISKKKSS